MKNQAKEIFLGPLINNNPVTLQVLGICSALAVTTSLLPALLMCMALTSVATLGNVSVSLIRHHIPSSIRIIIQITIISSLVIIVDQILRAYAYETSKQLSVFVGLIITNCIVLARTEGFAMNNGIGMSFLDGLGHGLGYSLILVIVASTRELLGAGTLMGVSILTLAKDGGWFHPIGLMLMAPSGFFIIGLLIWLIRSWQKPQLEQTVVRTHTLVRSEAS
ncbi:MAG: NADH:ubiquinone reductase (Na(+)-transporting) subunit D [Gammaproteobacteria bacterium]|nr:NADH:ubiquinone reductase (Na(+)-transporting) subunit D [Gammaproteobacteria bacterium]NIN62328.1 NADH:ubiquinone reductase (Na(+)-transporting) subunit D [Gammaproteobacteria bacterium]NIO62337.1 NADH:ubiquinone reductase (Na(+)-transporting) subunit D [Gammaproteobacteria bacterium]NIP49638.1 NADH:ubiquinone reductase (Na(+)-transporting) subunit D [Gammaproteobacteria bacterium]NIQ10863.1 NADH:ubiquinone reductase (Na(+)-transporting) subunit D [Gammaproteobacteria bacterium]